MKNYYQNIINNFSYKLNKLQQEKDKYVIDTEKDFTRKRKLDFKTLIKIIIYSSSKPIKEELYDYFDYSQRTATSSAFVQARSKLKSEAFYDLLKMINKTDESLEKFKGYRLIAVDGSDLAIARNTLDIETYKSNGTNTSCNLLHINSMYDILNKQYEDVIFTGTKHFGEQECMWKMVERFKDKAIFIADRNYPSFNNMEHIIKANQKFLIRCKDKNSLSSILRKCNLPDSEFDEDISFTLTTRMTNEIKNNPDKYRFLSSTSTFDFISKEVPYYDVTYRAVRFKIDGKEEYESIITNLDRDIFPPDIIKKLYNLRWGIETSFRHLKYATDLSCVHSKKKECIKQEILARMILYNLCLSMIKEAVKHKIKKNTKLEYTANITRCIHIIRNLAKRKGGIPPNIEKLLLSELLPIRPGRTGDRNVKATHFIPFNYRFS